MEYESICYYNDGNVAVIKLNRPDKLNALTDDTWEEIDHALHCIAEDDDAYSILLCGEGKSFCAGFDIKQSTSAGNTDAWGQWKSFKRSHETHTYMWDFPKPIICAVQGYCLGGGFGLANLADFVMAADDAIFGETELRFCLTPSTMNVYLFGIRKAKEIMMLADKFDVQEAYRLGVVNWVVPRAKLEAESMRIARKLAALPTETMQLTKHMINKVADAQGFKQLSAWGWDTFLVSKLVVPKVRKEFNCIAEEQGMKAAFKWLNDRYEGETPKGTPDK